MSDTDGLSASLELRHGVECAAALARYRWFDTITVTKDNAKNRVITGLAYGLHWQKLKPGLMVDDEYVRYDAAGMPDDNRIPAQTHVPFKLERPRRTAGEALGWSLSRGASRGG